MGDLSEHYNQREFVCQCPACRGKEFKIHLGLVGALEDLAVHFNKKPEVVSAFWCEAFNEAQKKEKRSYHCTGRAAHIRLPGIPLAEVFKYLESQHPELAGLGLYPKEDFIHMDTRPEEKKAQWVKEGERYSPLTDDKRKYYHLS